MTFLIGLFLGAVMVVFVLQNNMPVSVNFFGSQFDGSLALVLLLSILGGMLVSALLSLPQLISKSFRLSRMSKQNERLAEDLEAHKQKLAETQERLAEKPMIIREETTTVVEDIAPPAPDR
jgi:uncharacterized integral membrane protein